MINNKYNNKVNKINKYNNKSRSKSRSNNVKLNKLKKINQNRKIYNWEKQQYKFRVMNKCNKLNKSQIIQNKMKFNGF